MRICQLTTYPIKKPVHGGQQRVSQIAKTLQNNGHSVLTLSVCENTHDTYDEKTDFIIAQKSLTKYSSIPSLANDYATALFCQEDPKVRTFLKKQLTQFRPDYIFIEQAWLWPIIKSLKTELPFLKKVKIVYSSHNIESKLKQALLNSLVSLNIDNVARSKIIKEITILENDLAYHADFIICCTEQDALYFKTLTQNDIIVCPNGTQHPSIDNNIVKDLSQILNGRKFIIFSGSNYAPNAMGFWEMLGSNLGWLAPNEIIIVIGRIGDALLTYLPKEFVSNTLLNSKKLYFSGYVNEETLHAFYHLCSAIVIPITVGGGSNLKTAQAIVTGKPIIATSTAFRGFENFKGLKNIKITDDPKEFQHAIMNYLDKENNATEISLEPQRSQLYWENTLKPLIMALE